MIKEVKMNKSSHDLATTQKAEVSLDLWDGNLIKGIVSFSDIELVTAFGKLKIPVSKVSHIEVGISKDDSVGGKIKSILKILSTSGEDTKEAIYNDLLKQGLKAIPYINDFSNDPKNNLNEDVYLGDFTIENALAEIQSANNITSDFPKEDILTIDSIYSIGGIYHFEKLDVKTDYGSFAIAKEKIKSIDIVVTNNTKSGDYSYRLNASKHINTNLNGGWLKTGIVLQKDQSFSILSVGEINLVSLGGKYKPDGSNKPSTAATWVNLPTETGGYPNFGQVVYKIGNHDPEILKAGARFNGKAKRSGMLFISIYETVYNTSNTGSYNVKIALGK